jgi:hypothetical protein
LLFTSSEAADRERSEKSLLLFLEGLTRHNQALLSQYKYPRLYQARVRYLHEEGTEEWLDIPHIVRAGWGDCEDLACWRAAELRRDGYAASPFVRFRYVGGSFRYHVLVEYWDSSHTRFEEDPSLRLGMGWEEDFARRYPWAREREAA